MAEWEVDLVKKLEEMGEAEARVRYNRGDFGLIGGSRSSVVMAWLESRESERRIAREVKAIEISEEAKSVAREALSYSRDALSNSSRANRIALKAMILSAAAAIIAAIIGLFK